MRSRALIIAVALGLFASPPCAWGQLGASGTSGARLPSPVYWGQDVFLIPYQWSARTDQASAQEVILYLSNDQGANWSEVTRARPDVRSFLYRAPRDGEYWFAVRTLDNTGRLWPAGGYEPELRVVVDTKIPQLSKPTATLNPQGQLVATCMASDRNLDRSSVSLSVRHAGTTTWTPIKTTFHPSAAPGMVEVRGAWQAPAGVREVIVRAAIKDLADNPAGAASVVAMSASTGPASPAIAQAPAAPRMSPSPYPTTSVSTDPFLATTPFEIPSKHTPEEAAKVAVAPYPTTAPNDQPWPADISATAPLNPAAPNTWIPAQPATPRAGGQAFSNSPFRNASAATPGPSLAVRPSEQELLVVNGQQFALDYDLESVGKWGVSRVEVWGTRDGGQTWRAYAQDSDNRSPVNISTPEPGRYGFRILVQGVGSLPVDPPVPGDEPQVWVEVDPQQPTARITSAAQGEGYYGDHLIITWQAEDANLESRPVALFYSAAPSGPWMPIASSLENSGRYAWRLQRHLPKVLYLRIEARDRAGNLAIDQTQQPVALGFSQPAGRIRSARPIAP